MYVEIDSEEQEHMYSCLLAGGKEWNSIKKKLGNMLREDDSVDRELQLNAKLRKMFNPRAAEEALEAERKKTDPAQLSLEEQAAQTETGGMKTVVTTPPTMQSEELHVAIVNAGFVVPFSEVDAWDDDIAAAVEHWIGLVVAAHNLGGTIPDEPEAFASVAVSLTKVEERAAMGPYTVVEKLDETSNQKYFAVVHRESQTMKDERDEWDDEVDAQFFAAQFNLERLRNSDMSDEDLHRFAAAGPWAVVIEPKDGVDEYFIVAGVERERCASNDDAFGRAARYNRSIAERAAAEGWTDPAPVNVDDNAAQELKASEEKGEAQANEPEPSEPAPEATEPPKKSKKK